jgi:hypothetical protein
MKRSSHIKILASLAVSASLLAWLVIRVSPQALARAAAEVDWHLLVPATIAMVVALYLWDAVCLPRVYDVRGEHWSYWQWLHLSGLSCLGSALHYEIGQAALAWGLARTERTDVLRMLSRSGLLALHDVFVLVGLGAVGASLTNDPRVERIRPAIYAAVVIALAIAILLWLLPAGARRRIWGAKIDELISGWSLRQSLALVPLRLVYYGVVLIYAAAALAICAIAVDRKVLLSTIPLVLVANGFPSIAGLGTRDTALQLLLKPDRPEVLLAMSLIWSSGIVIVRSTIGLAHLWGYELMHTSDDEGAP